MGIYQEVMETAKGALNEALHKDKKFMAQASAAPCKGNRRLMQHGGWPRWTCTMKVSRQGCAATKSLQL